MKRNFIGIIVGMVVTIIGVYPLFAQEGTVSPPHQDSTPQIVAPVKSATPAGIPETLTAVQYRRCPMDGQRLKQGKPALFEGKAYRVCCDHCLEKFWENPQSVALKLKNTKEVPLTITNVDGECFCGKPASREFCRLYRETITFFCSSADREKETKGNRTTVSRQKTRDVITGK